MPRQPLCTVLLPPRVGLHPNSHCSRQAPGEIFLYGRQQWVGFGFLLKVSFPGRIFSVRNEPALNVSRSLITKRLNVVHIWVILIQPLPHSHENPMCGCDLGPLCCGPRADTHIGGRSIDNAAILQPVWFWIGDLLELLWEPSLCFHDGGNTGCQSRKQKR